MTGARKLTSAPDTLSNVIPLWPDIVVSASKPETGKRRKTRRKSTPKGSTVGSMTPSVQAENVIDNSGLTMTLGSTPLAKTDGSGSSIPRDKADFHQLVRKLSNGQLRKHFRLEAHSHSDMKKRRKMHGAVVHPMFEEFRSFLLLVGPRPAPQYTLDRVSPHDPEYGPGKVRWADKRTQANNRRNTIYLTADGETLSLATWARRRNMDPKTLRKRRDYGGWTDREIIYGRTAQTSPQIVDQPPEVRPSDSDVWPRLKRDLWEEGFQGFVAYAKHDPTLKWYTARLNREVFLAWIGGNLLRKVKSELRDKYPGYDDPEYDAEPPEVRRDSYFTIVAAYEEPVRRARSATFSDRALYDLLRNFLSRYPVRTLPQDWARLFKRREEE
ncbi:hypothetical protein HCU64_07695 [Methylobacterium sp. C25]|uniref:hypothetical protein n=1 Tax=Methylobacterium sp. C25 TaxID=2721622 RepID=UPI001F41BD14|nr:hypothetical protein [Methylobacterium sp. C25]MCE4223629.1 hypothetical protein [Methylobacterium sp. C25]